MSKGEFLSEGQNTCSNNHGTDESPCYKTDRVDQPMPEPVLKKSSSSLSTVSISDSISSFESTEDFRKVHFSTENQTIIDNCDAQDEEGCCPEEERWYKREELRQFKCQAKQAAQMVRSHPKLLGLIHSSHDLSIFIAEYGGAAKEAANPSMASVGTILATESKAWVTATVQNGQDCCRGLESILLREQRSAFAQDARDAVVEASYRTEEDVQEVAQKYQSFSTPSSIFAHAMAKADALESAR